MSQGSEQTLDLLELQKCFTGVIFIEKSFTLWARYLTIGYVPEDTGSTDYNRNMSGQSGSGHL